MLRKHVLLLFILLLFPVLALAQNNDLFDYSYTDLELSITNKFEANPVASDYYLDYVSAELSWFPREDYRQEVESISTEPRADFTEDVGFLFEWLQPSRTSFRIEEESRIIAYNEFRKLRKKIDFPIIDLDPLYSEYLEPQEMIDINEDIIRTAAGIVQGEDDLYRAVYKLAQWVEINVEYDLSTITSEAVQKSSWVLDNKRGVCDEITSLFISLCRSLGIPARFVTGISYSNINLQNDGWGPHGWAEVYFPEVGWVPFDVTYKELGFIDATHIKLKTSLDAKETSINYATKGRNTEIKTGKLEFDVNVVKHGFKVKPLVELSAEVIEEEVSFGSYNLLILDVKNLHSYYVTTRITLANVKELDLLSGNSQAVLLAPGEEKKLYWMIKVSPKLESGYIYTFPLKLVGSRGEEAEISFRASKQWKIYSKDYMGLYILSEQPEEDPYSKNVLVTCTADKDKIYLKEKVELRCVLDNKGNQTLARLSICLNDECSTTKITAGKTVRYVYTKKFETLGVKTLVFRAQNELVEKSYYSIIEIQDKPLLDVEDLSFPDSISYDDLSNIKFFVKKKSNTKPSNVKIRLEHKLMHEEWDVPNLERDYQFTVMLRGDSMHLNKNDFEIIVTYEDEQGNTYKVQEEFSINLNKPSFTQRIMIWLNSLDHKINDWISNI
ncbi:transglutaminase-like domain-containing protein [Candidatus Woesearchaeota archaeon]|nr:transglutaminase-like domain-containing protein [Candidatus Woesearchaeota archaeon]